MSLKRHRSHWQSDSLSKESVYGEGRLQGLEALLGPVSAHPDCLGHLSGKGMKRAKKL